MNCEKIKRIPYGISDYTLIRKENYYYVDKTPYLNILENAGRYLFFIRPRRFGKSLFLSMLEAYYDVAFKDRFEELFGGTWIYSHSTPDLEAGKSKHLVLSLNFSQVAPGLDTVENSFLRHIRSRVRSFLKNIPAI